VKRAVEVAAAEGHNISLRLLHECGIELRLNRHDARSFFGYHSSARRRRRTGSPVSVAVDPSGKFAYVANESSGTVSGYTIDPSTGALTSIANSPFVAGFVPQSVAMTPLVPFTASFAKLEIKARPTPRFDLKEDFTVARNTNEINPVTEEVTLQIGTFSVTIPTGSFKLNPNGRFSFEGTINGVSLDAQIVPLGNNIFTSKIKGAGVDLTGLSNPVTVVLTIGVDSGTTTVIAHHSG